MVEKWLQNISFHFSCLIRPSQATDWSTPQGSYRLLSLVGCHCWILAKPSRLLVSNRWRRIYWFDIGDKQRYVFQNSFISLSLFIVSYHTFVSWQSATFGLGPHAQDTDSVLFLFPIVYLLSTIPYSYELSITRTVKYRTIFASSPSGFVSVYRANTEWWALHLLSFIILYTYAT